MCACRFVFFGASTKCHVGEVRDRCDALQRTSADSVCDACVCHCILNFPWTWVTSICFKRTALFFSVWVDFCHCCMYTHQVTFYSSCFSTSHFSCSAFSSWFVALVVSLQLVYGTRVLECCCRFVQSCLYSTGKYHYIVACCSAFLFAAAFWVIDFSDVFCDSQNIM